MSTSKLFGKDILITSTTEATSGSIGSFSTLGGINVTKTILTAGGINSISNTNTLGNIFTTGGNIGIGTTAPTQTLSVAGDFNFTGSLFQNGSVYSGSTQWGSTQSNIYYNTGSVGLGTLAPVGRLHMANPNTLNTNNVVFEVGTTVDGANSGWSAVNFNGYYNGNETRINTSKNRWRLSMDQRSTTDRLYFDTYNGTTLTTIMSLNSNGNVGIGNNTATRLLQVGNLNGNTQGTISISNTGEARYHLYNGGDVAEWAMGQRSSTQHNFNITRLVSNVEVDFLTIQTTGNVGIGTTSPNSVLELSSSVQNKARLILSGQEFYQASNTSTSGIALLSGVNRTNNRQLWVADGANLTQNTTNPVIRIIPLTSSSGSIATIDSISTDGLTRQSLNLGNNMNLHSSGNVGIGTTAPAYTLDVNGSNNTIQVAGINNTVYVPNCVFTNNSTVGGSAVSSFLTPNMPVNSSNTCVYVGRSLSVGNSSSIIYNYAGSNNTANSISFNHYGLGGGMYLLNNGNVGIGITSPTERLSVDGSIRLGGSTSDSNTDYYIKSAGQIMISANDAATQDGSFTYLGLTAGVAPNMSRIDMGGSSTGSDNHIRFSTLNTERMRIGTSGNVGIGTNAPGAKLSVDFNGITQNQNVLGLHTSNTGTTDYNLIEAGHATSTTFVLKGSGNVGIGTTSPSAPLHVTPTSNISPANNGIYCYNPTNSANQHAIVSVRTAGAASGNPYISWDINTVTGWSMGIDNADGDKFKISAAWDSLSSATKMTFSGNNVGIMTTAPAYTLDVNGTIARSGVRLPRFDNGSFSGSTSFSIPILFNDTNYNYCEIKVRYVTSAICNINISATSYASAAMTFFETALTTVKWNAQETPVYTTFTNVTSGLFANDVEQVGIDNSFIFRINRASGTFASGLRNHYSYDNVYCWAGVGTARGYGQGHIDNASVGGSPIQYITFTCSSGTVSGTYSTVHSY